MCMPVNCCRFHLHWLNALAEVDRGSGPSPGPGTALLHIDAPASFFRDLGRLGGLVWAVGEAAVFSLATLASLVPEAHGILEGDDWGTELFIPVSIAAVRVRAAAGYEGLANLRLAEVRCRLELCARVSERTLVSKLTRGTEMEGAYLCLTQMRVKVSPALCATTGFDLFPA
eukprot:CAMPEP_0170626784 /NCGR_PEP_ID=MMETSP0224-20130122/31561_1 /TAXON_ID=285029 /ORGANISM="Togula jolla, Strain CCCM 725" /LENGTH=171 /DNA_ID=CAMNT_0010953617 /DNA_START=709 /DNA_END=1224 /DNA_ORIENTATION=-